MKNDNHIWYIMMILWYNHLWYHTISINKCLPMSTSLPPRRLPWLGALLRPRCRRPWPVWPSWRRRRPRPAGRCEAYFVCKICKIMWIPAISSTYHVNPCKIRLESKISKQKKGHIMPTGHASNIFQHLLHHIPWCHFAVTQPLEDRARLNFSLGHRVSSLWRMPRMYTIYGRAPFCDARILRSHLTAALVKHHGLNATKKKEFQRSRSP